MNIGGVKRVRSTKRLDEVVHLATLSRTLCRSAGRVRSRARKAYRLFLQDPSHRGLKFKKVGGQTGIYSARVGIEYRALGRIDGGDIVWFWIGPHGDYDNIV